MTQWEKPVLTLKNFNKTFGNGCSFCKDKPENLKGGCCPKCRTIYACRDVSLCVYCGEVVGIVGESGSGKSTLMQALYFDSEPTDGEYYLDAYKNGERNIFADSRRQQKWVRNMLLGMVYQNPVMGLKMHFSAQSNIAEKMIAAGNRDVHSMVARGNDLLERVSIPPARRKDNPCNFSGGMQQRVQIAKALANEPPVLLLDEITTGLDLSVQADVLELIQKIQRANRNSILLVSHDLSVIRMLADRTVVMRNGQIIEEGLTDQILEDPQHPYTQQLVYSLL
ncbi:MAG: ATP-binding cassette domain-containing protein [Clostridiales Family XIII bacterium]|jgi:putative phosphonate transport system ATP-binding protein|nr:ATP-binding cassette domain-containing protein [Clostridiales Family XIII bacterium]